MLLKYYLNKLGINEMPEFLTKYLNCPSLIRLKDISYFCGMDYASKDIYDFKEPISRYDHSLTCALLTYKLTGRKEDTLAALFHDISTPCFSHVIDYMNEDYNSQESTEEYTEEILKNDTYLIQCLEKDQLTVDDIANFKKYTIVDTNRPKLCTDRIDGILLPGLSWTKDITKEDINTCICALEVFKNEEGKEEVGFNNKLVVNRMIEISDKINNYCSSNEDNYMMKLLAHITKLSIQKGIISYKELYKMTEKEALERITNVNDKTINLYLYIFKNIKKEEIPKTTIENVKVKKINPLINGKRAL